MSEPGYPKEEKLNFQLGHQCSSMGGGGWNIYFSGLRSASKVHLESCCHANTSTALPICSFSHGLRASGLTIAIELQEQKSKSKQVRRLCFVEHWERKEITHPLPTGDLFYSAQPPLGSDPDPTAGSRNNPIEIYALQAKFYMAKGERGERQRGQVKKYICMIVGSEP